MRGRQKENLSGITQKSLGIKQGRLAAVSFKEVRISKLGRFRRFYWNCLCDCGRARIVSAHNFKQGKVKSCGCIRLKPEAALKKLQISYRYGAQRRGRPFQLKLKEFKKLTSSACYYCGAKPSFVIKTSPKNFKPDIYIYNGIDRIDNTKGYILGNCVSCCKTCNNLKRILSRQKFLEMVRKIYNHRIRRQK